jgi:hypothetical protein
VHIFGSFLAVIDIESSKINTTVKNAPTFVSVQSRVYIRLLEVGQSLVETTHRGAKGVSQTGRSSCRSKYAYNVDTTKCICNRPLDLRVPNQTRGEDAMEQKFVAFLKGVV